MDWPDLERFLCCSIASILFFADQSGLWRHRCDLGERFLRFYAAQHHDEPVFHARHAES